MTLGDYEWFTTFELSRVYRIPGHLSAHHRLAFRLREEVKGLKEQMDWSDTAAKMYRDYYNDEKAKIKAIVNALKAVEPNCINSFWNNGFQQ